MEQIDVSVIIPVYNVEKYLRSCLDTVVNQTLKSIEIILVNDGSTDTSFMICKEYNQLHNNIVLIDKENGGLSSARNAGLRIAKGKYIAFLDSDDFVDIKMYEILFKGAEVEGADIISCMSQNVVSHYNEIPNVVCNDKFIEYTKEDLYNELYFQTKVRFEVWTKLYKKEILSGIYFKEKQVYEDVYFERMAFNKSKKIIVSKGKLHYYLIDRVGNTNSNFNKDRLSVFEEFDEWLKFLNKENYETAKSRFQMYSLSFSLNLYVLAKKNNAEKETIDELSIYFKKYRKKINILEVAKTDYKLLFRVMLFTISKSLYFNIVTIKKKE